MARPRSRTGCDAVARRAPVAGASAGQRAASAASADSWMTNTFARPVIRKILSSRSWLQIRLQRAVVGADLLQAADQDAEAGGVEELDRLHVDDEVVDAGGDQLGDLVAQLGRGVDVDLAADGDDGRARRRRASQESGPRVLPRQVRAGRCHRTPRRHRHRPAYQTMPSRRVHSEVHGRRSMPVGGPRPHRRRSPASDCRAVTVDAVARPPPPAARPTVVDRLAAVPGREDRLTHLEVLPPRAGRARAPWPAWADPRRRRARFAGARHRPSPGSTRSAAAEAAHAGQHVVLATGTASGKSLAYQLPALTAALGGRGDARPARRRPRSTSRRPRRWPRTSSTALLGARARRPGHHPRRRQQPRAARLGPRPRRVRPHQPRHAAPLAAARATSAGRAFLGSLRYVVVDECHHYRGVFGAHVAHVLRRLRRVCASYGAAPDVRARLGHRRRARRSPPRGSPGSTSARSPTTPRRAARSSLALWEPPLTSFTGENGAPVRRAASLRDRRPARRPGRRGRAHAGLRPVPARRRAGGADRRRAARRGRPGAAGPGRGLPRRLPARGAARARGRAARRASCVGLAATNALELGIDVSGLDAVLMAGFPGTRAALWQQVGRAGRGAQDALGVLVARDDPLDTYLVHHPEALLGQPVEATVFDPANPYVLGPHLCAAAAGDARSPRPTCRCSGPTRPRRRRRADRRRAAAAPRRGAGSGPTGAAPADLADIRSAGGLAGAAGRGRDRPGGRHRRRRPRHTAPPTPARSTCTAARPGWSSRSTSTSTSP